MENKNTIWLASYPKSGNTWFRVFLTNYLGNKEKPAGINELLPTTIASSRALFDEATGLSSSDLSPSEIAFLRPAVYRYMARNTQGLLFHKIHDANLYMENMLPLVPPDITKGVIYFIRNPLDLTVSFSHHLASPIDETINHLMDSGFSFCAKSDRLFNQLEQKLLSWDEHIISWVDQKLFPVCMLRYEDMKSDPFDTFKKALLFCGLDIDDEKIRKSIQFSDITEMQKQEQESGFQEKPVNAALFFRKGEIGSWRNELTCKQCQLIIEHHQEMMKRFGYLNDKLEPVY